MNSITDVVRIRVDNAFLREILLATGEFFPSYVDLFLITTKHQAQLYGFGYRLATPSHVKRYLEKQKEYLETYKT